MTREEHYTDGRRWSYISNAWILLSSWNDREELACMTAATESVRKENVKLRAEIERLTKERETWHSIATDHMDADEQFRKVAGKWDTSDSLGIESPATILERVLASHEQQAKEIEHYRGGTMIWTREKPSQDCWSWYRVAKDSPPHIVRLKSNGLCQREGVGYFERHEVGEWCVIPEPKEPA